MRINVSSRISTKMDIDNSNSKVTMCKCVTLLHLMHIEYVRLERILILWFSKPIYNSVDSPKKPDR